jgi:hypothetical protein
VELEQGVAELAELRLLWRFLCRVYRETKL